MLNNLGLGFVFTARDLASASMRKLGANFSAFSGKAHKDTMRMQAATNMGAASIGLLTVGVGALGAAYAAAKTAGEFEQKLAMVGAISRASAKDMIILREAAIEAGMVTQFSPHEAAEGLANFAAQGFNARQSAIALTPALDLAAGGMISVSQATSTMSAAVKVFGGGVESAGMKADQLLRISNLTALQAGDLEIALGNVARGAIPAKQRIEEMLPAIGLVKNAGVDASVASTAIASALDFMAKNADKFKKDFGVDVADAAGNFRPFLDIVRDVHATGKDLGTVDYLGKLTGTAGRFGKTAFAVIGKQLEEGIVDNTGKLLKGAEAIEYLRREMEGAAGAAKEFRDRLLDNLPGQLTILKGIVQTIAVTMGEPLAKAFKPLVEMLSDVATRVVQFIEKIPGPVKEAAGKLLVLFGAFVSLTGVGVGIAAFGVLFAGALKAIVVASSVAVVALGAILTIIGAVKLAFIGYETAMKGVEDRSNSLTRAWDKLKLSVGALWALVSGSPISKEMMEDLKKAENRGVFEFVQSVGRLILRFKRFLGGISVGFKQVFIHAKPVFDAFFKAFEDLGEALGFGGEAFNNFAGRPVNKFIAAGFKVGRVVGQVIKFIVRVVTFMVNWVTGAINGVKAAFSLFSPLIDMLVDSFKAVVSAAKEFVEEIGLATEGSEEGISVGQMLGQAFGFVATVFKLLLIPIFIVFLRTLQASVKIWTFVVRIFKKGIDLIVSFFKDTLSPFFENKVVPLFKGMAQGVLEAVQPILDFFSHLFDKIKEVLNGINEFFGITEKLQGAGEAVANALGFTTGEEAPTMTLDTSELDAEEERRASAAAFSTPVIPYAASPQGVGGAAVAANTASASPNAAELAKLTSVTKEQLKALRPIHEMVALLKKGQTIVVDGQVLGTASRAGKDDSDAREFRQTPVEY